MGNAAALALSMAIGPAGSLPPPVIVASRTQGLSPLAVFFEGTTSTDASGKSIENAGLLGTDLVEYAWTFERLDAAEAVRTFIGFNAAHVFEPGGKLGSNGEPSGAGGTYRVTLAVRDKNGATASVTQTITVQPFTGKTYYVASNGSDSNAGHSATAAWKTYYKAFNAMRNNRTVRPGDRVLFERGNTAFAYANAVDLGSATNVIIGAYGQCQGADGRGRCANDPMLRYTTSSSRSPAIGGGRMIVVANVRIHANDHGSGTEPGDGSLVLRSQIEHFYGNGFYTDGTFFVDCALADVELNHLFFEGRHLALMGNSFGSSGSHNVYASKIDRGVIAGNHFHDSARTVGVRIARNAAPGSRNVLVAENTFGPRALLETKFTEYGSPAYGAHNILIERNYFMAGEQLLIYNVGVRENIIIRNNVLDTVGIINDPAGQGYPDIALTGLWLYHNTLRGGVTVGSNHQGIEIRNNIFANATDQDGAVAGTDSEVTISNSLYGAAPGQTPQFVGGDSSSPLYYQLQETSPAIDAGVALPSVPSDLAGNPRPIDDPARKNNPSAWDIGAFER